jgi:hypothetical protein
MHQKNLANFEDRFLQSIWQEQVFGLPQEIQKGVLH